MSKTEFKEEAGRKLCCSRMLCSKRILSQFQRKSVLMQARAQWEPDSFKVARSLSGSIIASRAHSSIALSSGRRFAR
jgi:hypothetical protein